MEVFMISINFNEENKKVLIVGGGKQAIVKGEKFKNCTYLSPSFIDEVPEDSRILKIYEADDVNGYFLVIAATNNKDLNHQIVCDCNERNILSASINQDEDAAIHFQKELDFPYLHIAFSTKGTCPGYHKILERDLNTLYQEHEAILEDLQIIRDHCLEVIPKYNARNDFINEVVEKDATFLHTLAQAIQTNYCKVLAFHSSRTEENVNILDAFTKKLDVPCFYAFTPEIEDYKNILSKLQIQVDYLPITLRDGVSLEKMVNLLEGENVRPISFTDKELSKMMREQNYSIYIYHPSSKDTLKNKLARSYEVYDFNETLPSVELDACVCLLLKGGHFQNEIKQLEESYPLIHFDPKCLFEQEFFIEMLLKKLG